MRGSYQLGLASIALLVASALSVCAAEPGSTNAGPHELFLTGPLGELVRVPTNEVSSRLLPPPALGTKSQIPTPQRGTSVTEPVLHRLRESREGKEDFQFFPAAQPQMMPYLASQDEFGNTTFRPGPLIPSTPFDGLPQRVKYWASAAGLRYSLQQTLTYVSMTDVMQGANTLGLYTFDFQAKWAVFDAPGAGTAGWISTQIETQAGLDAASSKQSPKANLGTVTAPAGLWSSVYGFRMPELAWQQSFRDGEVVAVAGMISQGNYVDGNSYANSSRDQFLNSALVNTMVMPLPENNFGVNLQWQPANEWYVMFGTSAGNAAASQSPWTDFNLESWALLWEIGYTPGDVFGLGPGAYRIQPFVARSGGPTQGGLCFNLQQQLGTDSRFGWFGRFGFGGSQVTAGASAQIGTGFVMRGPLEYIGLLPSRGYDAGGVAFVWSQPSAGSTPVAHENECVFEAGYVLQLTHTTKLQPDLQIVWNPAYNPDAGPAAVFQLQFVLAW